MFFKRPTSSAEQQFWQWFTNHDKPLLSFDEASTPEAERERLFDQLLTELHRVHPDLTFELGPPALPRELILSADGLRAAFPAVAALHRTAPQLPSWHIVAFRPRRADPVSIAIGDRQIDSRDVRFTLLDNGRQAGIVLFLPGLHPDDEALKQVGYLLLDHVLGEYDVETRLGPILFEAPGSARLGERLPLDQLAGHFDRLLLQLHGPSAPPA